MKLLLNTNLYFIIIALFITSTFSKPNVCPTGGPELYTLINDYQSCSYKIIAIKGDNSPIYGVNYEYTEEFDTAEDVFSVQANTISPCEGFDWIADNQAIGNSANDDLGYGYYYIEVIRNYSTTPVTLIRFYLDLRMAKNRVIITPDIKININVSANSTTIEYSYQVTPGVYNYAPLQMNDVIKIWENNFNQSKDFSPFLRNIELTNDFTGISLSSEKITLTNAGYGFPNQQYTTGTQFTPGQHIDFWHGVEYEFSVNSNIVSNNGINYQARHWNTSSNIGFTQSILIDKSPSFTRIVAYYLPTQPLTVTNNLEGGTSSDNFELTWQNIQPASLNTFGNPYNAFEYNLANRDQYTIKALPITSLRYGASWNFFNWNNGSMYDTIRNIKVNAPVSFTANYKGHFRSDNSSAYSSNSQQKTVRDNNSYYHTVYTSMGNVWYTYSLTTDFNGNWSQEEWIGENAKNPTIDFYGNNIVIVLEHNLPGTAAISKIEISWHQETGGYLIGSIEDIAFYPASFFGNAKPVIAYTNGEVYVAYKESASSTLKFWRNYVNGTGGWGTETGNIPNTTSNSLNVTLASRDNSPNDIHIAWQERTTTGTANSIKYLYSSLAGTTRSYTQSSFATISGSSGFIHNLNPSISLYSNFYPIVSWTGREDEGPASRTVIRPKSSTLWGSYLVTGSNVGYTVNQSVTGSDNTLIAWTENISTTKYARRINALYSCVGTELSHYGTDISLSGGNSLSQIKALVFKGTDTPPYLINKSTTDFSASCIFTEQALSKITENDTIVTFGRSGIVSINDIEFIFEIGDILVGDSIIKFIEVPDTLAYNSANELNQHTRTNNFTLTPATNFYFSNIYHVVQKSNPDTALTTLDAVNFKAELINALTDQVVGTFDNITYNKNNLEKYANIDYEVDCSGIRAGEYYLRLVTSVNGNTSYALSNIYNLNTTLAKKNFNQVNFTGSEIPAIYDLAQNFPNPFNPSTAIHYQIPQDGIVTLKIYDILGSEVATLVNEEKVAGKYEVNFNASSLASGVYIYKIQAGSFINSKKMILLK